MSTLTAARVIGSFLIVFGYGAFAASCTDPVLDDTVDAQGKETANIPLGPLHRAGQRCIACHQEGGKSRDNPFTVAGTIFAQPGRQIGVGGAEVRLTDSDGSKFITKTNCVGNFFIRPNEWQAPTGPKFPLLVEVFKSGIKRRMQGVIGREGDCSFCHQLDIPVKDPFSQIGHIYLFGSDEPGLPEGATDCAVDPKRPGSP